MDRLSKRTARERVFVWNRFLTDSAVLRSLTVLEKPNPDLFSQIVEKHGDEWTDTTRAHVHAVRTTMENNAWSHRVCPMQKKLDDFPPEYQGARYVGRAYGLSFQQMHHKIVNTLYFDTHRYLDAVCCFPTILMNAASHLEIPALNGYVTNREEIFQLFYSEHRLRKATVKAAVNSMIGSCPRLPNDFGLGAGMDEAVRVLSEHPFIVQLQGDLITIASDLEAHYPHFCTGIANYARRTGKTDHIKGLILSFFCQDVEHSMMRVVIETLQDGWTDELAYEFVWKYDGVMVPKSMMTDPEEAVQRVQSQVLQQLGLHVRFSVKDISSDTEAYQDCSVVEVVDQYQRWKKGFDRRFVKFLCPDRYGMLRDDGTYQLLSYGAGLMGGSFGFVNGEENQEFLKRWTTDPEKIIYQGMDFAPPPLETKYGFLNTFRGLRASNLVMDIDEAKIPDQIKPWMDHISIMCNHKPESVSYLHRHIAHILQRPGIKTGIIVFVRSIQGTGKDQMFRFLEKMVGSSLCHRAANVTEIKGNMSASLENKILVCLSECNYKDFKEHGEYLKDLATRTTFNVKQKYIPEYQARCNVNLFMFTNQFGGMNMDLGNRREFCIEADGKYANSKEYHEPFDAFLNDDANVLAVYRHYMAMDLGEFHPMTDRPVTDVMRTMASQTTNHAAWFLKKHFENWLSYATSHGKDFKKVSENFLRVNSTVFHDEFRAYCEEFKIPNMDTRRKIEQFATQIFAEFGSKLTKYTPDGITPFEISRSHGIRFRVFYIPAVQEWLNEVIPEYEADLDAADDAFVPPAPAVQPPSPMKAFYNKPGEYPKYVIKQHAAVVFSSNDLEEINKALGEAYITQKEDGSWALVHQYRNNREYPLTEDEVQNKVKVEMKYPWYVRNRCHTV
jgi:hypothetical protein